MSAAAAAASGSHELPYVGAVIRYGYLWRNQRRLVLDGNGRKNRPCLILAIRLDEETDEARVYVVPLTTQAPHEPFEKEHAIKLTAPTLRKLGLGRGAPSWILPTEANDFLWRGFDVVSLDDGRDHYGRVSPVLFDAVIAAVRSRGRLPSVPRE